jgi:AcrR family transcriptional regulator
MTTASAQEPALNKNGQVLGAKGKLRRARILDETVALLHEVPVTDINMAMIVRRAGITPAAYYLYFEDVGEAVLAALEAPTAEFIALARLLDAPWPPDSIHDHALAFINSYFAIWQRHAAVLRARNVLADSADSRFEANRSLATASAAAALTAQLAAGIPPDRPITYAPRVLASVLLTAVERSAIVTALDLHNRSRERDETSLALAHLFELALKY